MKSLETNKLTGTEKFLHIIVIISLSLFIIWPVVSVFAESFIKNGNFSIKAYEGLFTKNFSIIYNSFMLAVCVTLFAVPVSIAVGIRLTYGNFRGRSLITGVLVLSTISPPFLCSMAYLMLFGRRGLITWRLLGIEWNPYGFHGVLLMEAISFIGFTSLLIAAALEHVDGELERVSLDLGASSLKTFMRISLPLAFPGILAAGLVAFVRSLSDFGTPLFVGGRFQVLASRAYNTLIGIGNFQLACAMNALLILPAVILLFFAPNKRSALASSQKHSLKLPAWFIKSNSFITWTFITIQILVYGLIFLGSITKTWGIDFSLTSHHILGILNFRIDSIIRSLMCSVSAGVGVCFFSILIIYLLHKNFTWLRRAIYFVSDIPYLIPGTFLGVGYLIAFTPFDISAGFLIAMCCLFRQLSPSLRAAEAGLAQIDPALWDVIQDLGGNVVNILKDLLLPLLFPFLRVGFVNAFSSAMTTTGPIIFLVSPYARVASIELFESINEGDFGAASAMGSLLIIIIVSVNVIAWNFFPRAENRKHVRRRNFDKIAD